MTGKNPLKTAALVSLGLLFVLLIGAWVFFRERMLFCDAAYISFNIINSGKLQIQVDRYGSFITQIVPLITSKMHLPLRTVLLAYSLSFNLFYFLTGLTLYRLRSYALLVLMALYFTLFVSDTYFWTNNEVHQGVTWMFLMFGFLQYFSQSQNKSSMPRYLLQFLLFCVLAILAIYSHPLVMIPTVCLWIFLTLSGAIPFFRSKRSIPQAAVIVAICSFKYYMSTQNWYDGNLIGKLDLSISGILGTFTSGMADVFWKGVLHNHWLVVLVFLSGLIFMFIKKHYLTAAWTLLACLGYFVLVCLTFSGGERFYIESEWMPVTVMAAAPLAFSLLPSLAHKKALILVTVIFLIRLAYIGHSASLFCERNQRVKSMVARLKEKKTSKMIIRKDDDRLEHYLIMGWGLPVETIYSSILDGDSVLHTISYLTQDQINAYAPHDPRKDVISSFGPVTDADLNKFYFHPDTTKEYTTLSYDEFNN